jgi:tetratricopeptide (TPR) repeat protein
VWHDTQAGQWQEAYSVIEQEGLFGSLRLWGANVLMLEMGQLLLPAANWHPAPDQEATLYVNLGLVYTSLGQKPEALDYYQQALSIRREVGDRRDEGTTLWNIGASLLEQQHDVSLAAFLLAKHLFEAVQSPSQNNVQSWIDSLRHVVGEEQFALLVAQVEPHAQQILEQFLKQKKG